jgi:hypothetical protein
MKMMKVFDCQDMPKYVKKAFFDVIDYAKNDCYVSWFVRDELDDEDNDDSLVVTKWLLEEGAEESDEEVLIGHWW